MKIRNYKSSDFRLPHRTCMTTYTAQDLIKIFRNRLPAGVEDEEYKKWIRMQPCFYGTTLKRIGCSGSTVADHCLGGFHGIKGSGLLLIPSCVLHNMVAEREQELHQGAILDAIILRLTWESERIKQ